MYMNGRWEYDHEYFQQMIEHEQKVNGEAIGDINTNLREAIESDSSSSEDESMPDLQERAREDSSSDGDTNSFGDDGIYDDGEQWGPKELSLKQIIGGNQVVCSPATFQLYMLLAGMAMPKSVRILLVMRRVLVDTSMSRKSIFGGASWTLSTSWIFIRPRNKSVFLPA